MKPIEEYAKAIKEAEQAALNASTKEDGGTCNLDTVTIDFKGWRQVDINKVSELSGIRIGDKLGGFHGGCRFVWFTTYGQANERTRMAEAAAKCLRAKEIPVYMWYCAD